MDNIKITENFGGGLISGIRIPDLRIQNCEFVDNRDTGDYEFALQPTLDHRINNWTTYNAGDDVKFLCPEGSITTFEFVYKVDVVDTIVSRNYCSSGTMMFLGYLNDYCRFHNVTIESNVFSHSPGGVIAVNPVNPNLQSQKGQDGKMPTFTSVNFTNNTNINDLGAAALYVYENLDSRTLYVTLNVLDCQFVGNTGSSSGALEWEGARFEITNTIFARNKATSGAAVSFQQNYLTEVVLDNLFVIKNCTFSENETDDFVSDLRVSNKESFLDLYIEISDCRFENTI